MRIDAFNKVSQVYKTNNMKNTTKANNSNFSDKLEISQAAKDYQVAKQIVSRTPDTREDRVNDIRQRMAAGTYQIGTKEVADKIVDDYFNESI